MSSIVIWIIHSMYCTMDYPFHVLHNGLSMFTYVCMDNPHCINCWLDDPKKTCIFNKLEFLEKYRELYY